MVDTIASADEFRRLRLSDDPVEQYRATHDTLPVDVCRDIIARYPDLKPRLIHNKSVPATILETLADDPDPAIRSAVAMKRKAPPLLLERLADDPDESVRLRVAYNKITPGYVLEKLLHDTWKTVREVARQRLAGE
ncbi:MAG: HEAT repeat domain-containing protein [Armatimonadota bacterium]